MTFTVGKNFLPPAHIRDEDLRHYAEPLFKAYFDLARENERLREALEELRRKPSAQPWWRKEIIAAALDPGEREGQT